MNEPVNNSSASRRPLRRALAVVILLVGIAVTCFFVFQKPSVEPPAPALENVYAEVASAIEEARDLVLQSPSNGAVWGNYGMVLAAHEYIAEPIICFKEAARLSPDEMKWWYFLGDLHAFSDREFAIECFRKASELSAEHRSLINARRADLLIVAGKMNEARPLLVEVVKTESINTPANDHARISLARIALAEDTPSAALGYLELPPGQPRSQAMLQLTARVHRQLGNLKREQETLKEAESATDNTASDPLLHQIQRCRVDPHWLAGQAKQAIESGKVAEGIATLQRLIDLHPTEIGFRISLVQQLILRKQFNAATELLGSDAPGSGTFDFLRWQGTLSLLQEDWSAAIQALEAAIKIKPASSQTKRDLGLAYEKTGKFEKALELVSEAAQLDSAEPEFKVARIRLLRKLKRNNEAAEATRQFQIRFPNLDLNQELEKSPN
jgi:tetratricopeptide (TPR) repeat protein